MLWRALLITTCLSVGILCGACRMDNSDGEPAGPTGTQETQQSPAEDDKWKEERRAMVRHYIEGRSPAVRSERVLDAMRNVRRHLFVPGEYRQHAYTDRPLPIGFDQTISQPYIVALMTDRLAVESDDRVLEVGTGSGYQAAVLAELCREVYTVEIVEGLAKQARERLQELNYEDVHVRQGDGFYGWEEHAPFDAIIVTAAADKVPDPLLEQLKVGGRMVVPLEGRAGVQRLTAVKKTGEGEMRREQICLVRFVPMTGQIEKVD